MKFNASTFKKLKTKSSPFTVVYIHALIVLALLVLFPDLRLTRIVLYNTNLFSIWMFLLYNDYFKLLQIQLFLVNLLVFIINSELIERWLVPAIIIADMAMLIFLITNNIKTVFIPQTKSKESDYSSIKLDIAIYDDSLDEDMMHKIFNSKDYNVSKLNNVIVDCLIDQLSPYDLLIINTESHHDNGLKLLEQIRDVFPSGTLDIITIVASAEERNIAFYLGSDDVINASSNRTVLFSRIKRFESLNHIRLNASESAMLVRQSQIKPHFLFNALSVISSNISDKPEVAKKNIQDLSIFLRKSFENTPKKGMISLEEELELIKAYLSIEKSRFDERLNVEWNVDENIKIDIPILCLQPLVYNAIQHGISKKRYGGSVHINISEEPQHILFEIIDNGVGIKAEQLSKIKEFMRKSILVYPISMLD